MDISKIGGYNPITISTIQIDNSADKYLVGTKPDKVFFDKETISDNFSRSTDTMPAVEVSFNFYEALIAGKKAAIEKAVGAERADKEMRLYWFEYNQVLFGDRHSGWRNLDLDTMYSQAAELYKQIEDSSDNEETKALKRQALENALKTGTGMYSMNKIGEKLHSDALEAKAQGKAIDRSYRSKAKFDKLCELTGALQNITSAFFGNLKNGKVEGTDYETMIADAVNKMMSYRHPN